MQDYFHYILLDKVAINQFEFNGVDTEKEEIDGCQLGNKLQQLIWGMFINTHIYEKNNDYNEYSSIKIIWKDKTLVIKMGNKINS